MPNFQYAPTPLYVDLKSKDQERVIAALKAVKSSRLSRTGRYVAVLRVFQNTESARVRNAAALALADLRFAEGAQHIVEKIKDQRTTGSRGTLFFALSLLHAKIPVEVLISNIFNDSFESQAEAAGLLIENIDSYSSEDLRTAKKLIAIYGNKSPEIAHELLDTIKEVDIML